MRLRRGSAATVVPPHSSTERNKTMKLTKTQIKEKQEELGRHRQRHRGGCVMKKFVLALAAATE